MPGFGEKLRSEREARHVTIERIADETGIQRGYLEALEANAFGTLPGRSFGKLYIRSYARMLGIDPQPLIEEYDRELQRTPSVPAPPPEAGAASSRPVGSMVSSWRQARIAGRRRPATDFDEDESAAAAGEAIGAEETAPPDETAALDESASPDESAAPDTSIGADDAVTESEQFDESHQAQLEDVGQATVEEAPQVAAEELQQVAVGEAQHVAVEEASSAVMEEACRAEVEDVGQAGVEEAQHAAVEDASSAVVEEAGQADVEDVGHAAFEEAQQVAVEEAGSAAGRDDRPDEAVPDLAVPTAQAATPDVRSQTFEPHLAPQSTPSPRIRWKTAVGVLTLGLLVVLSAFAVLTIGPRRSEEAGLAPAGQAGRSSPSAAGAAPSAPTAPPSAPIAAPSAAKPSPQNPVPQAPSTSTLPEPRPSRVEESRAAPGAGPVQSGRTSAGDLSVTESALGRRIADRRVLDQGDRFAEGTEVWFQTRVLGGEPGDAIRHVWIHAGRAVQSIRLPLGRSDWRTQSRKTIRHVGPWAVEARDEAGRVLARTDFTCEPSAR